MACVQAGGGASHHTARSVPTTFIITRASLSPPCSAQDCKINAASKAALILCPSIGDSAFSVAAPRAWNRLPTDLQLLRSTNSFLRQLKKTLLFDFLYGHQDTD